MPADASTIGAGPDVVSLPEVGRITLANLDHLRTSQTQLASDAETHTQKATTLESEGQQKFADAGAMMVPRESEANISPELKPKVDKARSLVTQITSLDGELREIADRPHAGLRGTFGRLSDWNSGKKVQSARDNASSELRDLLVAIGRAGALSPIAEVAKAAAEGAELEAAAAQERSAASECASEAAACDAEIKLRESSQKEMGFDALYTAAYLSTFGPPPIVAPMELKRGEQALVSMPATLSRNQTRTRYVGGSQGFSFPIGHTGIRYRVGSFHGQPISQQVLTQVDRGSVVVTTHRLAFVGNVKSVVVQLPKIVHIEVYGDGLAVFHEGRENADFLLCGAPKQVVFYVNWALNQLNS